MVMENAWLVWKVPKGRIRTTEYHKSGVYPAGELMAICPTEEDADKHINYLEEFSPSAKFGESENPRNNSMEDAPYFFTKSNRDVTTHGKNPD